MASYIYTRDLTEESTTPREVHVYTKKERWENWWDYNLKWVLIWGAVAAFVIYFILDVFVLSPTIDYQLAIVSPYDITDPILTDIEDSLALVLEDLSGDDVVTVQVSHYLVDLSDYAEDYIEEETDILAEEGIELAEDEVYITYSNEIDAYSEMAGQVQLSSDFTTGMTNIFILYDPANFQLASSSLCYPDGTTPEDGSTVAWQELVYELSDCSVFSETTLEALDGYYIARRATGSDASGNLKDTLIEQFAYYQDAWDIITEGATPYSEKLA